MSASLIANGLPRASEALRSSAYVDRNTLFLISAPKTSGGGFAGLRCTTANRTACCLLLQLLDFRIQALHISLQIIDVALRVFAIREPVEDHARHSGSFACRAFRGLSVALVPVSNATVGRCQIGRPCFSFFGNVRTLFECACGGGLMQPIQHERSPPYSCSMFGTLFRCQDEIMWGRRRCRMQPSVEGVNGESVVSSRGCIRLHRLHPTSLLSTSKGPEIPSSDKWLARRKAERQKGQISC